MINSQSVIAICTKWRGSTMREGLSSHTYLGLHSGPATPLASVFSFLKWGHQQHLSHRIKWHKCFVIYKIACPLEKFLESYLLRWFVLCPLGKYVPFPQLIHQKSYHAGPAAWVTEGFFFWPQNHFIFSFMPFLFPTILMLPAKSCPQLASPCALILILY